MLIEIFDNEFVKCELDDGVPVLRHRWLSAPSGEDFKNNLNRMQGEYVQLKKSYGNLAWLAETQLLGELDESVETWLVEVWEDLLFNKAGVRVHAVILGGSIFGDYPMEKFKLDAEEKYKQKNIWLGVFSNDKDAYNWIKRKLLL